ncbi:ornithine cyclodeaminase family protein [Pseudonocardia sp. CA-107938]|uniref:ornithine cyclodeaminase family protein n=1 Tax=Pseudonocardia sp. CA-107938 TaxID=3240021 RepID=UPI003D8D94B6
MTDGTPRWVDAATVARALPVADAVDVLEAALRAGLDPEQDGQRSRLATADGVLLQMPSTSERFTGTKVLTVRPANEGTSYPAIQGVYVLFEGAHLAPMALLDGAALTTLRTPAMSALAVRHLAPPGARRVALFGTGVQAFAHVDAVRAVLDVAHVDVVGRTPARVERLVAGIADAGISATAAAPAAVAHADVVICATASPTPLFDGGLVAEHALVVAIGSHTPDEREVDTALVRRSTVVVEARSAALSEAGDVLVPVAEGAFDPAQLVALAEVVRGAVIVDHGRPRLFKGTGMPWQDLVTAGAVVERLR